MASADSLCKYFGPDQARQKVGSDLFDTLLVFLNEFFEKVDFKLQQTTLKKYEGKELKALKSTQTLNGYRDIKHGPVNMRF